MTVPRETTPAWRCIACGRPLIRFAAMAIKPNGNPLRWGPKCAIRAGLITPKRRSSAVLIVRNRRRAAAHEATNTEQLDIFGATA